MIRHGPRAHQARHEMLGTDRCVTPSIVLAEVVSKCLREGLDDPTLWEILRSIGEASLDAPIDGHIAFAAARATEELRREARREGRPLPALADGLVLATARSVDSRWLTGDPHFRSCPETLWLR
jgi:predicted nucleic acid-binding protein